MTSTLMSLIVVFRFYLPHCLHVEAWVFVSKRYKFEESPAHCAQHKGRETNQLRNAFHVTERNADDVACLGQNFQQEFQYRQNRE